MDGYLGHKLAQAWASSQLKAREVASTPTTPWRIGATLHKSQQGSGAGPKAGHRTGRKCKLDGAWDSGGPAAQREKKQPHHRQQFVPRPSFAGAAASAGEPHRLRLRQLPSYWHLALPTMPMMSGTRLSDAHRPPCCFFAVCPCPHVPKAKRLPEQIYSSGPMGRENDPIVQGKLHQRPLTTATWQDPLVNSGSATSLVSPWCYYFRLAPAARWQAKLLDATCRKPRGILVGRANQASICGGPNLVNGRKFVIISRGGIQRV